MLKPNRKSERRIIILIVITFTVVTFLGLLAYNNLTKIIKNVGVNNESETKQLLLKEIFSDLSDAESSVKSYSISKNDIYLKPFYNAVSSIDNKMELLYQYSKNDQEQIPIIDSLNILIEKKYYILNQFLEINPQENIKESLNEISEKLNQEKEHQIKKNISTKNITSSHNKKQKQTIFNKIFGKNKLNIEKNTKVKPSDTLNKQFQANIKTEILKLKEEQFHAMKMANEKELALILQDKTLMDKLRKQFLKLELLEEYKIKEKNESAKILANKTNQYVALFCIIASLLLLTITYMLVVYTKRSRDYRRGLKVAKIKAEELAQAKQSFLANMSHEIRTPMNAIIGFSDQLSQTNLSANQQSQVKIIQKSCEHLLNLINNILDFSKLESGKLTLINEPFNFYHTIENIIKIVSQQAQKRGNRISFSIDENIPQYLEGDEVKLNQVLFNVIGNAIKFTANGNIFLSAKLVSKTKEKALIELSVSDTGIGIKKENLSKIFNEFEQLEDTISKNYGGTGLGLAITKKIIELQGGQLKLESTPGKGTTINFSIDYKISNTPKTNTKTTPTLLPKNIKIIAVDDEEYNAKLLQNIFDNIGIKITTTTNGSDFLKQINTQKFDLILLDLRMPKISGIDLAKTLRKMKIDTPIIALSATVNQDEILNCYENGINEFISKPFKQEELFKKIKQLLQNNKTENKPNYKTHSQPIDYSITPLIELSNGDENFVKEMINLFIKSTKEAMQQLHQAYQEKNLTEVANQAHKMASPCRHIEALTTVAIIKQIENICRKKIETNQLEQLIPKLQIKIEQLITQLQQHN